MRYSANHNQPDHVIKKESGHTNLYFRPKGARPPDQYDVCVPHKTRKNWVVYIAYIAALLCIIACGLQQILSWLDSLA